MKPIHSVHMRRLNMTLKHPFMTSFGSMDYKEFYIIEAIDNEGRRGIGETVAFPSPWYTEETVETNAHIIKDFLIPLLKDKNINHPRDVRDIFKPVKRHHMAKAALEEAVWDLYAKQENISLAKALGGVKQKIDVGISIGIQSDLTTLINKINTHVQEGYKRIKLKIKPGWDIDMLREVRKHFHDLPIMADANSAYTLHDIEKLKKLDEFNLMMIEQPLAHDDIIDHAQLQKELKTPICLDESIHSTEDARKAINLDSCHIINIKIGRVGGLTEAKDIHDLCKQHHIQVWCGGMLEAGVGRAHNLALSSLPQFTLPGDTAGSALYWENDIITPEVIAEKGVITLPDKPGIGYAIDERTLDTFTISEDTFMF